MSKRIVVVQRRLTHYRVPFFDSLREQLAAENLELVLAYGNGTPEEMVKNDGADLDWGHRLLTKYFVDGRVCYQPLGSLTNDAAMLVMTLENKLICNLWHQFSPIHYKVGLWGHGANLQGNPDSLRERFKARVARRADWWFGYTEMSRSLITRNGFPNERITILNNSVDTSAMQSHMDALPAGDRAGWRTANGIGAGPVGIFLGSLYAEKRIDFLLQSAQAIRQVLPNFELVLVGAGPQLDMVKAFCAVNSWAHYLGTRNGLEKVRALAACDVMLNPGLVGLGILDSLVCGLPMVTTDYGLHSPEIAYLSNHHNGLMTANNLGDYVHAVLALLRNPQERERYAAACRESGRQYSVANMARNFADGVQGCLAAPIWRGKH